MHALDFIYKILTLRIKHAFSVTSYIRTVKRNAAVQGVADSYHLIGLAVDAILDDASFQSRFITDCKKMGLKVIDESDHLHIQPL